MSKLFNDIKKNLLKEVSGSKKLFIIAICVFLFGLIGNAYGFLDFNFSHDSSIMVQSDDLWQVMIGRYLQPIYVIFRGKLYSPFLVGMLSLVYVSFSTYLITDMLKIKTVVGNILTSGVLVTNSVFCLTSATYIYLIDVFMLALMSSCIGTYFCIKYKNRNILAVIFLTISLALYQSYWQVAILILMFSLIQDILQNIKFQDILKKIFRYILVLILSILVYYIFIGIFQKIYGVSRGSSYNSIPSISTFLNINDDIHLIKGAYKEFFRYYIHPSIYAEKLISVLSFVCFLINGVVILINLIKNKINFQNVIILVIIILLLPLGGNIVYVITHGMEHGLMLYSLFIPYVFCISMFENNKIKFARNKKRTYCLINTVTMCTLIFNGVIYSNQIYMKKHVEYSYTYATLNRIIYKIEEVNDYVPKVSQVMFIGNLENSSISVKNNYFNYKDVGLSGNFAVTYLDTYRTFINNIMGYPMNIITDEKLISNFSKRSIIKELPAFPAKDCITVIDDIIVVKLSEVEE